MIAIYVISSIGFLLSSYVLYVENKKAKDDNYRAVCDINDRMSCTKAFTSGYGKTFGISNGILGMLFYLMVSAIAIIGNLQFVFYLALASIVASVYLWYVLTFKVKAVCVVCYSIYATNIVLLIASYILK